MSLKKRKRGVGTQLDIWKKIRKDMPSPTKVIKPKNQIKNVNNWKDYLDEDEGYDI